MKVKNKILTTSVFTILIVIEFVLRFKFGFCDALLYSYSENYEYIAQPNQIRRRFGANIYYNSYSQRSEEPDSTKSIILGLGDSVLFGGTWMEQDSLATTIVSRNTGIQMLNISAGSWGPDNCAAYLKEKGTFGAKAMILICSSHDAYDVMNHHNIVGKYSNYPDKQYKLAIWEMIDRYFLPRVYSFIDITKKKLDPDETVLKNIKNHDTIIKKSENFNPGFNELKNLSDSLNIPFIIYLHAETSEINNKEYNIMGQEIIDWALNNNILLIKGLKAGEQINMYKDVIHFNEKGQKFLSIELKKIIDRI